ncbi:MAG: DUF3732 domain-containing protein [Cyclobacteriaceae bacterium]|nr:DUF3732 domain-containing protein [Cyclobacteriaceae bacterium]
MKFILHEIKLWFNTEIVETKSYEFEPNKINVITGDATTGKSSFWSIIDYCLLSGKVNIPNTIYEKVLWFGIRFTINHEEISIIRKAPEKGAVSADLIMHLGTFPEVLESNTSIAEAKSFLDKEFGITDALRFPHGKESGKAPFNVSYRHFLLFNALTETVIGAPETYFDTTFFGKDEYDKALSHIFDLVIGVNDMDNIKALERLKEIDRELASMQKIEKGNQTKIKNFETDVYRLIDRCKQNNFIEYDYTFESVDEALAIVSDIIENTKRTASNSNLFAEIDVLNRDRYRVQGQINAITQYQKEYDQYRRSLNKSADSLQPIQFLNQNLSDQLVDSYETKLFIESLETSLNRIKSSLSRKATEPVKVEGDVKELKEQLSSINARIGQLEAINKNNQAEGQKFIALGEIKFSYEQIIKREISKPIDTVRLNSLNLERETLSKVPSDTLQIKRNMLTLLNESIQRNFNQLNSLPAYKNSRVDFNPDKMVLQLYPDGQIFPLDNVGSKSNYMFMHLCVYLGLHEHMINVEQEHVPQFLFIDQPSIPYYTGDNQKGNDDKSKLIDAFTLLNSFISYINASKKEPFQIFMVEHAPQEYWLDNELSNFHTVDEFIDGRGLIPQNIYSA